VSSLSNATGLISLIIYESSTFICYGLALSLYVVDTAYGIIV